MRGKESHIRLRHCPEAEMRDFHSNLISLEMLLVVVVVFLLHPKRNFYLLTFTQPRKKKLWSDLYFEPGFYKHFSILSGSRQTIFPFPPFYGYRSIDGHGLGKYINKQPLKVIVFGSGDFTVNDFHKFQ